MPRTQAFNDFIPVLRTARELVAIDSRDFHDPPQPAEQNSVRGLRGGSAVLMVAGFEAYLDDVLREFIEYTRSFAPAVVFSSLPDQMRVKNVFGTLEIALKGPPYQPAGTKLSRLPAIHAASTIVANENLNPEAFGGTAGNPAKVAVREVLKSVGIADVYAQIKPRFETKWGAPVHDSFIGDKLDEIVRRRHRVAHRAEALSISRQDLRDGAKFLRALAETIDIQLGYHFRRVCRISR